MKKHAPIYDQEEIESIVSTLLNTRSLHFKVAQAPNMEKFKIDSWINEAGGLYYTEAHFNQISAEVCKSLAVLSSRQI